MEHGETPNTVGAGCQDTPVSAGDTEAETEMTSRLEAKTEEKANPYPGPTETHAERIQVLLWRLARF